MQSIKKTIKEILQKMGFSDIEIDMRKDNSLKDKEMLFASIEMGPKQSNYFLKENALGLSAFQHLLRILISKEIPGQVFFVLDINNYRKQREKSLIELALKSAEKVRKTKKPVSLGPMPAYERRLIHLKLAEESDIVTESTGQEPERKLVVRLYP